MNLSNLLLTKAEKQAKTEQSILDNSMSPKCQAYRDRQESIKRTNDRFDRLETAQKVVKEFVAPGEPEVAAKVNKVLAREMMKMENGLFLRVLESPRIGIDYKSECLRSSRRTQDNSLF